MNDVKMLRVILIKIITVAPALYYTWLKQNINVIHYFVTFNANYNFLIFSLVIINISVFFPFFCN